MEIQQLFPGLYCDRSWVRVLSTIQLDVPGGHCPTVTMCQSQRLSMRQLGGGGWRMVVNINVRVQVVLLDVMGLQMLGR